MFDTPAFASPIPMFALVRRSSRHLSRCASSTVTLQVSPSPAPSPSSPSSPPPASAASALRVYDARGGLIPYDVGWRWQHALVSELKRDSGMTDALLLLEHSPVYTLGTRSDVRHVLFLDSDDNSICRPDVAGAELVRTERGGEVTYHGPGQLVIYAILNLSRAPYKKDLHWYLRKLEDVVITLLQNKYGIESRRIPGKTGVWTTNGKIAAIGLKVSKWITMHGVALNVDTDLSAFDRIVPCGIDDEQVTSLKDILKQDTPDMDTVKRDLVEVFQQVFHVEEISLRADAKYMGEAIAR